MPSPKPKLVIAGPGAGKTYNMVETIIEALPTLSQARYIAVITYTNSATANIKNRLAKKIKIPDNLFIGTIHAFMNRFIVIPFGSFTNERIGKEKLFIQCQIKDLISQVEKLNKKTFNYKQIASIKSNLTKSLNEKGYIAFDQTLAIAEKAMNIKAISEVVSNRIQYLFIDEFQDTDNKVFNIIEKIKKLKQTEIYVVGDPEQYISSYDSSINSYENIPILKAASKYEVEINTSNRRCNHAITNFLNNFNSRQYGNITFAQKSLRKEQGEPVKFIQRYAEATHIIEEFTKECNKLKILENDRCIIAKNKWLIKRIYKALDERYITPNQSGISSPLSIVRDTILSKLQLSQSEFCKEYNCDIMLLRRYCVEILQAVISGQIVNDQDFVNFAQESLGLTFNEEIEFVNYKEKLLAGLPININDLRAKIEASVDAELTMVSTVHKIKGLEAKAVLAIAKSEDELKLWLTTDQVKRAEKRKKKDESDYSRIGYVAFSRAENLLCIGCMEQISKDTKDLLHKLNVTILEEEKENNKPIVKPLF